MKEAVSTQKQYEISLVQDHHFHSFKKDYQTLYQNFSLLSYFERTKGVQIVDRFPFTKDSSIEIDQFYVQPNSEKEKEFVQHLFQMKKSDFDDDKDLIIEYRIGEDPTDIPKQNNIKVVFSTEVLRKFTEGKEQQREYIFIKIIDLDSWIQKNFKGSTSSFQNRISQKRLLKPNSIEYYYQEPLKHRTRAVEEKHLSIALQGGGSKGVSYIGVFQALKNFYKNNLNIKSVIGSSAGGILGLAICLSLSKEEIINSAIKKLSKITEDDKKVFENHREREQFLLNRLKSFILQYNLFDSSQFYYIQKIIKDQGFQQAFLKVIEAFNPSLVNLFTFIQGNQTWATVLGLLEAALMTGNVMKQIAVNFLRIFYKKYNQNPENKQKIEKSEEQWAKNVTFSQLFKIHKIQFTCTSVDLRDHILRFFNHKTTPDLPVCRGVQMTGSFPAVFESQSWKKQWGKYYVHYSNTRREIDLEGVYFTDGGTLANFPVKYLDNEKMRPMYFSYKRYPKNSKNQTILYGFGVNDLSSSTEEQQEELSKAVSKLGQAASNALSWYNKAYIMGQAVAGYMPWGRSKTIALSKDENPSKRLKEIPLFKFLMSLIEIYKKSKDQLTLQCFENDTFTVPIKLKNIKQEQKLFGRYDHDSYAEQIERLIDVFEHMVSPHLNKKQPYENTLQNFEYLLKICKSCDYTENNLLEMEYVINIYLYSYAFQRSLVNKNGEKNEKIKKFKFGQKIIQMDLMNKEKTFYECNIREDFLALQQILEEIIQYFQQAKKGELQTQEYSEKSSMQYVLEKMYTVQIQDLTNLRKDLRQFYAELENTKEYLPFPNSTIIKICQIKQNCTVVPWKDLATVYYEFLNSSDAKIRVAMDAAFKKGELQEYILRQIKSQPHSDSVHVVFQSAPLAQKYASTFMIEMEKVFAIYNRANQTNLSIKSVTTTNFYSIAAFLYASDFSQGKIFQEIWGISNLIIANPDIDQNYNSKLWQKINTIRMRELQNEIWKNRKQVYQFTENQLDKVQNERDLQNFYNKTLGGIREEVENTRDQVNQVIEDSLYFVLEAIESFDSSDFENVDKIGKKLSLKLKSREDYEKKNNQKNNSIIKILSMVFNSFGEIFKFFVLQQPSMCQTFVRNLKKQERKNIWKGLLTGKLLTAIKVKTYICEKLEEMGLKRTATLKQYYELTSKHIHINLTAVQIPKNVVTIINHKTRPYMPVWAAIIASCSLPLFIKPMSDRLEWKYAPETFQSDRIANKLFSEPQSEYSFLASADLLVKFPLQLVTNKKLRTIITDQENQLFLNFAFNCDQFQSYTRITSIDISRFNFATLYSIKKSMPENFFSLMKTIPIIKSHTVVLENYVNSHDNLIKNIYKDQLVILPIRLGTVDFNKTVEGGNLSDLSKDAIEQAYYVVEQKLINEVNFEKHMFFKVEKENNKMHIRFLSFFNDVKGLLMDYHIHYKYSKEQKYLNLKDEYLLLKGNKLWLKIDFPEPINKDKMQPVKKTTYFHKLNLQKLMQLQENKFSYVYKYMYSQFNPVTRIKPENGPQERFVQVNSFFDEKEPEFGYQEQIYCNKCSSSLKDPALINIQNEKCYNKHDFQCKLKVQCKKCEARFCVQCKFLPTFKRQAVLCPLGHKFIKQENRIDYYNKNHEIPFIRCDYCERMGASFFRDKDCNVTICLNCTLEAKLS